MRRGLSIAFLGLVTTTALVVTGGSAGAQPVELSDQEVVSAVDDAASSAGQPAGIGLDAAGATVSQSGPASVSVSSPTGATTTLTANGAADTRVVDGSAVADLGSTSVVSEVVGDSTARQTLSIPNASAPSTYTYDLALPEGLSSRLAADGGVEIFGVSEGVDIVFGTIAAPWAKDANGTDVPTSYQLAGNTITQTVQHQGAAYPVTADPKLTFGTSVYLNLWGWEANAAAYAFNAAAVGGVVVGCSSVFRTALKALGAFGRIADGIVGLLCTFGGAAAVAILYKALTDPDQFDGDACFQKDIFRGDQGFYEVDSSNCS